jgi:hypothetical protein
VRAPDPARVVARMWEARCEPGRLDDVVAWVRATVVPDALEAGASTAEAFRSEDRVVLITRWAAVTGWSEPAAPAGLVARSHAWDFEALA